MNKRITITRELNFEPVNSGEESDGRTIEGYAAVFGQPTRINNFEGNFTESISRGAFTKTLSEKTPVMQWNHGRDSRIGTVPIGVYDNISEDDHGLKVKGRLFNNDVVEPVRQAIAAGAVSGQSFTFQVIRDEWRDGDGNPVTGRDLQKKLFDTRDSNLQRTIKEVRLTEAGPVLYPAYSGTSVAVRSTEDLDAERGEIISGYMRSSGLKVEDDGLIKWLEAENVYRWLKAESEFRTAPEEIKPQEGNGDAWVNEGGAVTEEDKSRVANDGMWEPGQKDTKSDANKPYGDVAYADPGYQSDKKKRYPIDTEEHVKAALSYIGQSDNASKYSPEDLKKVKASISTAAKKFGIDVSESKSESTEAVSRDTSAAKEKQDTAALSTVSSNKPETTKKRIHVMTLTELREKLAVISVRMEELGNLHRDSEMNDADGAEFDGLTAERTATEASIAKIEARLEAFKSVAATAPKRTERGTDTPAFHKSVDVFDVDAIRRDSYNDEDLQGRYRDGAMRAAEVVKFGGGRQVNREDAQEQIQYFLDDKDDANSTFAKRVLVTGAPTYERAWAKALASGNPSTLFGEEARALALGSDGSGGYAVPVQLDPTVIWTSAGVIDPLRQLARVEQIVGKEWQGITSAGATVTRSAEAAEVGDNSFTLAQKAVRTNRVAAFVPFSYELAESWGQVRSEITAALVDAKGREEATSFLVGDGSTAQQPGGLLGSLSGNTVAVGTSHTFVAKDIYNVEVALDPRYRANGKILSSRALYNLVRQFDTAGGAQLWERIGAGLPSRLLGYESYESSVVSAGGFTLPDTAAHKLLVFGDFSNFLIVDRIGMSVELIPQVFGTNGRPTGQRGIYAIWMNNSKVLVDAAFKVLVDI